MEVGAEDMGSSVFSTMGESTIAEPSNTPGALASSTVDSEGFRTAGGMVGLLPPIASARMRVVVPLFLPRSLVIT